MKLLDWIRGPEQTQRAHQSKDDLDRVLATMQRITDETQAIDLEKLRRRNNGD